MLSYLKYRFGLNVITLETYNHFIVQYVNPLLNVPIVFRSDFNV